MKIRLQMADGDSGCGSSASGFREKTENRGVVTDSKS